MFLQLYTVSTFTCTAVNYFHGSHKRESVCACVLFDSERCCNLEGISFLKIHTGHANVPSPSWVNPISKLLPKDFLSLPCLKLLFSTNWIQFVFYELHTTGRNIWWQMDIEHCFFWELLNVGMYFNFSMSVLSTNVHPSINSTNHSPNPHIHLSIHPFVYPSIHPPLHPSIYWVFRTIGEKLKSCSLYSYYGNVIVHFSCLW